MQPTPLPASPPSTPYDFFFWWSVISTVVGIIILCFSIWQTVQALSEKARKKDQVKIWMQDANGISLALMRIIRDNLDKRYSSTDDMANTVYAVQASAFALYQSLYEERCVTEKEYKQLQEEFKQEIKKRQEQQQKEQTTPQSLVNTPQPELQAAAPTRPVETPKKEKAE